jgi:hypothetical protein
MADLPDYYFRARDNGAVAFRIDSENRARRLEMEPIAVINMRSGEIRPQGERTLTEADMQAIRAWMGERAALTARREADDLLRMIDQMNQTAHWAQSRASDEQLAAVTDALLLAMHDLRAVLVRRAADRIGKAASDDN